MYIYTYIAIYESPRLAVFPGGRKCSGATLIAPGTGQTRVLGARPVPHKAGKRRGSVPTPTEQQGKRGLGREQARYLPAPATGTRLSCAARDQAGGSGRQWSATAPSRAPGPGCGRGGAVCGLPEAAGSPMDGSGEDEPAEGTVQLLARRQRREKRELQGELGRPGVAAAAAVAPCTALRSAPRALPAWGPLGPGGGIPGLRVPKAPSSASSQSPSARHNDPRHRSAGGLGSPLRAGGWSTGAPVAQGLSPGRGSLGLD